MVQQGGVPSVQVLQRTGLWRTEADVKRNQQQGSEQWEASGGGNHLGLVMCDNGNESACDGGGEGPFRTSCTQVYVLHIFDPLIFIPDKVTAY